MAVDQRLCSGDVVFDADGMRCFPYRAGIECYIGGGWPDKYEKNARWQSHVGICVVFTG